MAHAVIAVVFLVGVAVLVFAVWADDARRRAEHRARITAARADELARQLGSRAAGPHPRPNGNRASDHLSVCVEDHP